MTTFLRAARLAFGVSAGVAALAGCGESHSILALPSQVANGSSAFPLTGNGFQVLHNFMAEAEHRPRQVERQSLRR